jgi:hypothetical protein
MNRTRQVIAIAGLVLAPALASAQTPASQAPVQAVVPSGVAGRFSFTVKGGLETNWGGDVLDGGSGRVLGASTEVGARSFNDIYDPGYRLSFGAGYGFSSNLEAIIAFSFGHQGAEEIEIGSANGQSLRAGFGDYSDWTLEFGGRYHVKPESRFDPYVSGVFGFRRVDAIPIETISVPDIGVTLTNVGFYDESTVAMFGFDFGFEYRIGSNASVGAEMGYRWQAKPGQIEGFEPETGLQNLNDVGSRYALPVLGFVTYRFE